jgi:hypothetical protein
MFEMVSPRHTIIVQPEEEDIVFHGARDLRTLRELDPILIAKDACFFFFARQSLIESYLVLFFISAYSLVEWLDLCQNDGH